MVLALGIVVDRRPLVVVENGETGWRRNRIFRRDAGQEGHGQITAPIIANPLVMPVGLWADASSAEFPETLFRPVRSDDQAAMVIRS